MINSVKGLFFDIWLLSVVLTIAVTLPIAAYQSDISLPDPAVEEEPILFSEDITFNYSWVSDGEYMPYALYTPSCADEYDEIPLIVCLHGTGQIGVSEWEFRNWSLLSLM